MIVLAGLNGAERSCNDSDEEDRQLLRTATAQSTPFGERASACLPLTLCVRSPPLLRSRSNQLHRYRCRKHRLAAALAPLHRFAPTRQQPFPTQSSLHLTRCFCAASTLPHSCVHAGGVSSAFHCGQVWRQVVREAAALGDQRSQDRSMWQ